MRNELRLVWGVLFYTSTLYTNIKVEDIQRLRRIVNIPYSSVSWCSWSIQMEKIGFASSLELWIWTWLSDSTLDPPTKEGLFLRLLKFYLVANTFKHGSSSKRRRHASLFVCISFRCIFVLWKYSSSNKSLFVNRMCSSYLKCSYV